MKQFLLFLIFSFPLLAKTDCDEVIAAVEKDKSALPVEYHVGWKKIDDKYWVDGQNYFELLEAFRVLRIAADAHVSTLKKEEAQKDTIFKAMSHIKAKNYGFKIGK